MWQAFLLVAGLGALAGLIAGFISGGLSMPQTVKKDNRSVWDPGFIGAIIAGAASAALLFALYGPVKEGIVIEVDDDEATAQGGEQTETDAINVTVYDVVAAAMSGLAGSRILTSEVEKKYLRSAASVALTADPTTAGTMASVISSAAPIDVFKAM